MMRMVVVVVSGDDDMDDDIEDDDADDHWKNRVLYKLWKFRLPTNFHTMEVPKRLEVDFQQISIPWKCPKG